MFKYLCLVVGVGVGVGEKVRIDSKWRIVIPAKFRTGLKPRDELIVERRGDEIILRKIARSDVIERFREIKLFIHESISTFNAEHGKHRYGGLKE